MSVRAIEAEVSIKSGVQAECTIGREVPYYIDRHIYDGQTEVYPSDVDIVLPTAGLAVESDILIHAIPKDAGIVEGEFQAEENGVFTINLDYDGEDDPKIFFIRAVVGSYSSEFLAKSKNNAISAYCGFKYNLDKSDYTVGSTTKNLSRNIFQCRQSATVFTGGMGGYNVYANVNPGYGDGQVIKFNDNKTLKLYCSDTPNGGNRYFMKGIRYKYQVFY